MYGDEKNTEIKSLLIVQLKEMEEIEPHRYSYKYYAVEV